MDLDPVSPYAHTHLGWIHPTARRYDEALLHFREARELDPHFGFAQECRLWTLMLMGRFDEALAGYEALGRGADPAHAWLLAAGGRSQNAGDMLRELETLARKARVDPYAMAAATAKMGDMDRAIEFLGQACEERNPQMPQTWADPFMDALRDDSRYRTIVDRVAPPKELRAPVAALEPPQPVGMRPAPGAG